MVRAPTIERKTSLSGANEHGMYQTQKTDHQTPAARDSISGMNFTPTVKAVKMQFSDSWLKRPDKSDMERSTYHELILSQALLSAINFLIK